MDFKKYKLKSAQAEEAQEPVQVMDRPITSVFSNPPIQQGFRDGRHIHISDLIHKCARAIALHYTHKRPFSGITMNHQLGFTFAQGEAMAGYVEQQVRNALPDNMYGGWSCNCGKEKHDNKVFSEVSAITCSTCKSPVLNYHELCLKDDEYMISGSIDITLKYGHTFYVNELKSLKKDGADGFLEITRPKPLHRLQALFYVWLMIRNNMTVSRDFSVFYMNKAYAFKMSSQIREFVVSYAEYDYILEPYLEKAAAIQTARTGGALPCRECSDIYSTDASKCELAPLCFKLED